MLRGLPLLAAVLEAVTLIQSDASLVGAESTIRRPDSDDFPNKSAAWTVEVGNLGGEVTVWEDGSSELGLVDFTTNDAYSEHRQLDDLKSIQVAVEVVRDWVMGRRLPAME
ncbi:hypothetical protein OG413_05235 [Streptomyces sp. NBC_01433]|uniref:hypothetical protein n=1 Tax=Streptomyces sp. NBC_01433 TaxID=2903864 RepID=UPI0022556355|nr:hypothetical protein [Streptomyces sp. NBC_01433]MCX4674731.1 hypothetical protein [Streptomyces sp. NBC_01433]